MAESTMAKFKRVAFKMAAIIKLNEEWKIEVFYLGKMDESNMAEFKLAAIIELS